MYLLFPFTRTSDHLANDVVIYAAVHYSNLVKNLIAILAIVFWGTNCKPTLTCEDIPCPYGQFCNELKVCEFVTKKCTKDADCSSRQRCDFEKQRCLEKLLPCTETFTCPTDQSCNVLTGFCEPEALCSRDGCPPGETCNKNLEKCIPTSCTISQSDCPTRFFCASDRVCTAGCENEEDCPVEESCLITTNTTGVCAPSCQTDTDCPFGTQCTQGDRSFCESEGPCEKNSECRNDEICKSNQCIQPPCTANEACDALQFCDLASGSCISTRCEDDIYGTHTTPNFSFDHAASLNQGDYRNLRLCPGSSDWFKLRFRASDIVKLYLTSQINADLEVYIFDQFHSLVARDTRIARTKTLNFSPAHDGDFYVEVRTKNTTATTYNLKVESAFCANDIYEANNTKTAAKHIPFTINTQITLPLRLCPADEDWFVLKNLAGQQGVSVEFNNSPTSLTPELYAPNGRPILLSRTNKNTILRVGIEGDYFLRLRSKVEESRAFTMKIEPTALWECSNAGLNLTQENALASDKFKGSHLLCPASSAFETDWLTLPEQSGLVKITIKSNPKLKLEAVLWSGTGGTLKIVRNAVDTRDADDNNVHTLVFQAQPHTPYTLRISTNASSAQLFFTPSYTIELSSL